MINCRIENLKEKFDSLGIDCALTYKDANRNYLSGFTGNESYLLVMKDKSYFITDSRYTEQAKNQVIGCEILEYKTSIYDFINEILVKNNVKSLGIEEDYVTYFDYNEMSSKYKNVKIKNLNHSIEKLRIIKDESEIECISKAASIADKAFEHVLSIIKIGIKEVDVALELEFYMKKNGAQNLSFETIVASGKRSSLPHGAASEKVIEAGDFVTMDFGCIHDNYCSDMTRTVVVGKANEKQKEIYKTVLKANEEVLKLIKPGMNCFDVDKIARDIIKEEGYGERFGHGLGHGVGREIHEMPRVSFKSKESLEEGMVVTDEPGIYIPNFGGVRIEDLLVITKDGCNVLSKSPKELIEL